MKMKASIIILVVSAVFSSWLYWGSDTKMEQLLTSQEWQSKMVSLINNHSQEESIGPLTKVKLTANAKYLPNGTYIRMSVVRLFSDESDSQNIINISETGQWDINDNYLLISPTEFKDVTSTQSKDFTQEQLNLITQVIKMDAEQSRRIDIVNPKTLLLTSLNHGSTVLFAN